LFLMGTLGAVFSSLLGVWQCVPYLFADCWNLVRGHPREATVVDTREMPYRGYLLSLAVIPMIGLFWSFRDIQMVYALIGALLFPLLALALLVFNGNAGWVGERFKNRPLTVAVLVVILAFFTVLGARPYLL
jgi:hypothetical protein